jgi:hypothetical protein
MFNHNGTSASGGDVSIGSQVLKAYCAGRMKVLSKTMLSYKEGAKTPRC